MDLKQYERFQNRQKVVEEDIISGRFFDLATTFEKYVNGVKLHEIENDMLDDYTVDFEMTASMLVGEIEQKSFIRFKNADVFEKYINAIDVDYNSEDIIFTSWL